MIYLEHVEHSLGNNEATCDVDERQGNSGCGKGSRRRVREQSAAAKEHSSGGRHPRNSVGDGHERRMECWDHAPHRVIPTDARQGESGEHGRKGRVW